jgi:hypothetical protein
LVSGFAFWQIFGDVAPSWRQDGDQERQDERTWPNHEVPVDMPRSRVDAKRSGPELLGSLFLTNFGTFWCLFLQVGGNSEKYENEQQSITFA